MIPFRKILFPVDYSVPCEAVVPYVAEAVRHFSAELTLLHAYGPEAVAHSKIPITDPDLADKARVQEEQRLREFALEAFSGQHVECFAELGEAGFVIHKIVQHQGADLVMLATHGHGAVRRFLLGSVAAKVLHDLSVAVWTGTGSALMDHAPQVPYKAILCALDERDESEGVLNAAAALACAYRAKLSLVHVVEIPPATLDIDFTPYKRDLMDAADFRLRELKGQLGIDAPHAVIEGAVADGVREEAVRRKADLIVTGRGRAQTTLGSMWSHVYAIVRESPCPVLSI
jgi:nucleotide-binding universal stress UspA family protein